MLEEHEAKEVVQNCECCEDEDTFSPQDTAETMGDALQFQNHGDASLPSAAVNSVNRIVDFKSVSQDLGARNPIGASGIEKFKFKNQELVKRKSEIEFLKPARSVLSNIEVVAKNWVKGNGLLVGLISKLRSKTSIATTATKVEADANPDGYEAADTEEKSTDTVELRADLNSGEVLESCG